MCAERIFFFATQTYLTDVASIISIYFEKSFDDDGNWRIGLCLNDTRKKSSEAWDIIGWIESSDLIIWEQPQISFNLSYGNPYTRDNSQTKKRFYLNI